MTQQMLILKSIYFYMRRCLKPKTISYRKQRDTDFYDVVDYNRQVKRLV